MKTQPKFKETIRKVFDTYEELLDKYETEEEFNAALEKRFEAEMVWSPALLTLSTGAKKLTRFIYSEKPTYSQIVRDEGYYIPISKLQWPTFAVTSGDTGELND